MAWDGPILTDSGGFQVFSLRDTIARVDDDGVTFRSVYDGSADALHARARRRDPGEPRQRHRDVPRPGAARPASPRRRARGGRAPHDRVGRAPAPRAARRRPAALRDHPGRRRSASSGGARPRRSSSSTSTATRSAASRSARTATRCSRRPTGSPPLLPADKPRYFMGIGDPEGILEVIEAGVDMFDCVLPTRTARTGSALTRDGRLNLRNARFARDPAPARRDLRLPGLRTLLAGLHPPPRQPERAARPPPALAPQSTLPDRADPRRARRDRARRVRRLTNVTRSKGCQLGGFLIVIVIFGAVWLLFLLPRAAGAAHRTRRCRTTVVVGDDDHHRRRHPRDRCARSVDELVRIEIAPGVVVAVDRRAIAAVAREVEVEVEPEPRQSPS